MGIAHPTINFVYVLRSSVSDSWNPVLQTLMDTSDLIVKKRGKIECRPVLPTSKNCYIPKESWHKKNAYVAVKFNQELTEATLIGSLKTVKKELVSLEEFQPI
jgi:Protein of unknown function (DUF1822)